MELGVLGPLMMTDGGVDMVPKAPKARQLLGFLMINANKMVRASDCIEELWGSTPPVSAMSTLQTHVLHIRRALRPAQGVDRSGILLTQNPGYQLSVEPETFDRFAFTSLACRGREAVAAGRDSLASEYLSRALRLWRGPALADVQVGPLSSPQVVELEETRQGVLEQRIEADLRLGRHHELVPELAELGARHPTHENIQAQLMVALYRCGRRSDAVLIFHRLRQALVETLGIEPAPGLRRLYQAIERG